jgi:hypothetical protein
MLKIISYLLIVLSFINGNINSYTLEDLDRDVKFISSAVGINEVYLKAIAAVESNYNPLTVNVNKINNKPMKTDDAVALFNLMKKYNRNYSMKVCVNNNGKKNIYNYRDRTLIKHLANINAKRITVTTDKPIAFTFNRFTDAKNFVKAITQKIDNVDIGLMQVNYAVWLKRKHIPAHVLLDPLTSLYIASYILAYNFNMVNNMRDAVKVYHSWNDKYGNIYIAKIDNIINNVIKVEDIND